MQLQHLTCDYCDLRCCDDIAFAAYPTLSGMRSHRRSFALVGAGLLTPCFAFVPSMHQFCAVQGLSRAHADRSATSGLSLNQVGDVTARVFRFSRVLRTRLVAHGDSGQQYHRYTRGLWLDCHAVTQHEVLAWLKLERKRKDVARRTKGHMWFEEPLPLLSNMNMKQAYVRTTACRSIRRQSSASIKEPLLLQQLSHVVAEIGISLILPSNVHHRVPRLIYERKEVQRCIIKKSKIQTSCDLAVRSNILSKLIFASCV